MVPLVLEKAETYLWLGSGFGRTGPVSLEPEEVFHEHPVLTSFDSWETPVARMPDAFVDIAAWGSRYPNHDTGTPAEAIDMLRAHAVDDDDDRPTHGRQRDRTVRPQGFRFRCRERAMPWQSE